MDEIARSVTIERASRAGLQSIEHMMQFYNHDLSRWIPIDLEDDGFFRLQPKDAYWNNVNVRPHLIRVAGLLAGFVVVDDEVSRPECTFSIGFLFVANRYRRQGVGAAAVRPVLRQSPGRWEVQHFARNEAAAGFWSSTIENAGAQRIVVSGGLAYDQPTTFRHFEMPTTD